ncbi:MAG TPA: ParB/RepB/Spo0J family partition protein [Anaerovoracaceae bacterium]|nr:ParB/RepB/Spo0J family partition protein [Anaerovoracaceae bacterium]
MAAPKNRGLGRGLDALFADQTPVTPSKETKAETVQVSTTGDSVIYVNIHHIKPNENQPRKNFDEEKIEDLANSIKEHGIIQPLVVRKKDNDYEIVAGERRWRAARKAELKEVPCIVREFTDEQNMLIAIIENMQREDLNPIEEAEGLQRMVSHFGLTQEEVSKSVGKSRPYITNSLRLLKLPEDIRQEVLEGNLSTGHARTLITVTDSEVQSALCKRIIAEGLSVRETEKLVASIGKAPKKKPAKKAKDVEILKQEEELKEVLGTRVVIGQTGKKGKIEIEYYSREELERLLELLKTLK